VTLEFDLTEAARQIAIPLSGENTARWGVDTLKFQRINLARMANFYISAIHFSGANAQKILVDRMRLLKTGANDGSAFDVLRDTSAYPAVQELPAQTPQWSNRYAGAKDNNDLPSASPDSLDLTWKDMSWPLFQGNHYALHAADNNHMFMDIQLTQAMKSVDGGHSWTDFTGTPNSTTTIRHEYGASAANVCNSGAGEDIMSIYVGRCAGESQPTAMYFRYLKYNGAGWDLGVPSMITPNSYHCPEFKLTTLRLENGRIWTAMTETTRQGKLWLRAYYSDDEGTT